MNEREKIGERERERERERETFGTRYALQRGRPAKTRCVCRSATLSESRVGRGEKQREGGRVGGEAKLLASCSTAVNYSLRFRARGGREREQRRGTERPALADDSRILFICHIE